MNYLRHFRTSPNAVSACLVGAGEFGRSLLGRAARMPWLELRIIVDRSPELAAEGLVRAGIDRAAIALCDTAALARSAFAAGKFVAAGGLEAVLDLPFNILVEASGQPEPAAVHALEAIEAGRHVAMVTKEADVVVGPFLAAEAARRGVVCTPIDGDQPSLLIGMITWAETLGFEVIAAGKSSEYDFVFDPASGKMSSGGRVVDAPGMKELWSLGERPVAQLVAARAAAVPLPQHLPPDLCELAVVANATGYTPDMPTLHAPIARIGEVPSLLTLREYGGLLGGGRRLDVFHCLRLADEISIAGGLYIVVRCEDAASWQVLEEKGHILSRNKECAMIWLPRHLLGMEVGTSLLEAVLHGVSSGGPSKPVVDLVARARMDLPRGTVIRARGQHYHDIEELAPELASAAPIEGSAPVPIYLLHERRLQRDVRRGELVRLTDVEMDPGAPLFAIRRRQDALFYPAP